MTRDIADKRRFYSIPLQLKYAVYLTLISSAASLIMILVMAWFIQRNYNLFLGDELGISAQVIEMVRHEQRLLEIALLVLYLVSTTVTFTCALYVTRKLVGPMMALQRQLWLYSRGDWTREFRLRFNDEFKELEPIVNLVRQNYLASHSTPPSKSASRA